MSDPILNGTNPDADRRLMDDVLSAPDPFDGGCPADTMPMVFDLPISTKAAKFDAAHETHSRLVNLLRKAYTEANDAADKAYDHAAEQVAGPDRDAAYRAYIETARIRDGVARAWDILLKAYSETARRYSIVRK